MAAAARHNEPTFSGPHQRSHAQRSPFAASAFSAEGTSVYSPAPRGSRPRKADHWPAHNRQRWVMRRFPALPPAPRRTPDSGRARRSGRRGDRARSILPRPFPPWRSAALVMRRHHLGCVRVDGPGRQVEDELPLVLLDRTDVLDDEREPARFDRGDHPVPPLVQRSGPVPPDGPAADLSAEDVVPAGVGGAHVAPAELP